MTTQTDLAAADVKTEPLASHLSLRRLLAEADKRYALEAKGYRSNPTDGNCRQ